MDYFDIPAISNSSLNYIDPDTGGSPKMFKMYMDGNLEGYSSSGFELGTLVHQLILEPETIDMEPANVPGPKVKELIDKFMSMLSMDHAGLENEYSLEDFFNEYDVEDMLLDFYKSRSLESKINTLLKEGSSYWSDLCLLKDKTLVSPEVFHQVHNCYDGIQSNDLANFLLLGGEGGEFTEARNEIEITWKEEWAVGLDEPPVPLNMKSKIDRVLVNDNDKSITLVDLKTTRSPLGRFQETLEKYNYHRQMAFYQFALSYAFPGYTLKNVYIVAVQTNKQYPCEVFHIHDSYLELGWHQACQLINRICLHTQSGNWSRSQESLLGGAIELALEDE
jgi:hypothetical protein